MFFKHVIVLGVYILVTILLGFLNIRYEDVDLNNLFYTAVVISISHLIFRVMLEGVVSKRIKDSKARYSFRKTIQILFIVISSIFILRIWVVDPQALLVAYGLIAAGVAISLQDIFKNFAGGITIFLTNLYNVGDRIEVNDKFGDVIDVGIFYTTILEIKGWVDGDQATGRISMIPNGSALSGVVNNYTKDHKFLWDEISFPITYDSDWQEASIMMKNVSQKETESFIEEGKRSISRLGERYYLLERKTEPTVFFEVTDNWINLTLRYVVDARERRIVRSKIVEIILGEIEKNSKIKIASSTMVITGIPEINIKKGK